MSGRTKVPERGRRVGKDAWVEAARDALIQGGLEAVKVDRIAKTIGAKRTGFYWHFESREQLLTALVDHWQDASTKAYAGFVASGNRNGEAGLETIINLWRDDKDFDPLFDAAMRDWARVSADVAKVVKQVDRRRIEALQLMFSDLGYDKEESLVRARIAFMHQVGYYTMGFKESAKRRRELAPLYLKVLLGR